MLWSECERQLHYLPLPFIIPLFPTLFVVLVCVSQAITGVLLYVLCVCGVILLFIVVQRLITPHSIPLGIIPIEFRFVCSSWSIVCLYPHVLWFYDGQYKRYKG